MDESPSVHTREKHQHTSLRGREHNKTDTVRYSICSVIAASAPHQSKANICVDLHTHIQTHTHTAYSIAPKRVDHINAAAAARPTSELRGVRLARTLSTTCAAHSSAAPLCSLVRAHAEMRAATQRPHYDAAMLRCVAAKLQADTQAATAVISFALRAAVRCGFRVR